MKANLSCMGNHHYHFSGLGRGAIVKGGEAAVRDLEEKGVKGQAWQKCA